CPSFGKRMQRYNFLFIPQHKLRKIFFSCPAGPSGLQNYKLLRQTQAQAFNLFFPSLPAIPLNPAPAEPECKSNTYMSECKQV
ncbi:hypothetical protein, partial [Pontibacter sp. 172403-2]|uniref:hypothetical protein n=1 Tax=Pontibacter rufus TaxID=2791028 RepID=UPI001E61DC41